MPDYPPAKPVEAEGHCWLCGGDLGSAPWPLKKAFADTFTDFPSAKRNDSGYVCCACVATSKSDAFGMMADKTNRPKYFPVKEGKKPRQLNWVFSSHVFNPHGIYLQPDRPGWRAVLLDPPKPPFGAILAVNGKKHVIFRGAINHSRDRFFVQADERRILVDRVLFAELLALVERGYALGFSKSSMETGDYNQAAVMKSGLPVWRSLEAELAEWRRKHRGMLMLAAYCCIKSSVENP